MSTVEHITRLWRRIQAAGRKTRVQTQWDAWAFADAARRPARRFADFVTPMRGTLIVIAVGSWFTLLGLYLNERADRRDVETTLGYSEIANSIEVGKLQYALGDLADEQRRLRSLLLEAGYVVTNGTDIAVDAIATGYSSTVDQTDSTPFITAANTRVRQGVLALSRDLLKRYTPDAPFDFGDVVYVSGIGKFIVEDSMNRRWHRRADIWFTDRPTAIEFGKRRVRISTESDFASMTKTSYGTTNLP